MQNKTNLSDKITHFRQFFARLESLNSEQMMRLVEEHLNDDCIEVFVEHIENFYGIENDEELGTLAQLMVTGYLIAKSEDKATPLIN